MGEGSASSVSSSQTPPTMYVTGRDPNSTRQQGMNVDKPSVSRTSASSGSHSSMGVDVPRMVGDTHDPHNGRRDSRSSGFNVDRKSALADHPRDGDEFHLQDQSGTSEKTATGTLTATGTRTSDTSKNGEEKENVGHYKKPSASGLNVDSRNTKSSAVGVTSKDHGVQETKSAYHVDKAGATDRTRSGMNVDGLATSSVHLAEASHHDGITSAKDAINTSSVRRDSDRDSLYDKVKNVFHRHGDDNGSGYSEEVTAAGISGAHGDSSIAGNASNVHGDTIVNVNSIKGKETSNASQTVMGNDRRQDAHSQSYSNGAPSDFSILGSSSDSSSEGGRLVLDVPAGYDGPLPQVAPGEDVVWVKRITQTDYYDDAAKGEKPQGGTRKSSIGNFFGRIRGGGHHQDVDKGKKRA